MERRGIRCDDAQRAKIEACRDLATLNEWLDRASVALRAADVFLPEEA